MSTEWITDRRPTRNDSSGGAYLVYDSKGMIVHLAEIGDGEAWKPIPKCEPYVKPKRWRVSSAEFGDYVIYDAKFGVYMAPPLPTREAAERIAAIYEEVMP